MRTISSLLVNVILFNKQITFVLISPTRSTEMLSNHFFFIKSFFIQLHVYWNVLHFLKVTYVLVFYIKLFKSKKSSHNHCSMLYKMQFTHRYKCYLDRLAFYIIRRDLNGGGQFLMATEQCRFLKRTMSHSELHVSKKYKTCLMENPDQF